MDNAIKIKRLNEESVTDRKSRFLDNYSYLVSLRKGEEKNEHKIKSIHSTVQCYAYILQFVSEYDDEQKEIAKYCEKLLEWCSRDDKEISSDTLYLVHKMLVTYLLRMPTPGNELYRDLHFEWDDEKKEIETLLQE